MGAHTEITLKAGEAGGAWQREVKRVSAGQTSINSLVGGKTYN